MTPNDAPYGHMTWRGFNNGASREGANLKSAFEWLTSLTGSELRVPWSTNNCIYQAKCKKRVRAKMALCRSWKTGREEPGFNSATMDGKFSFSYQLRWSGALVLFFAFDIERGSGVAEVSVLCGRVPAPQTHRQSQRNALQSKIIYLPSSNSQWLVKTLRSAEKKWRALKLTYFCLSEDGSVCQEAVIVDLCYYNVIAWSYYLNSHGRVSHSARALYS